MFETFSLCAHVSFFNISYYSITITLVSASSYFTLTVPMREVCVHRILVHYNS